MAEPYKMPDAEKVKTYLPKLNEMAQAVEQQTILTRRAVTASERIEQIDATLKVIDAQVKRLVRERELLHTADGAALWNLANGG